MALPVFILCGDLVKQVRTPPVRPADGVVGCVYESSSGVGITGWEKGDTVVFVFAGRSRRE